MLELILLELRDILQKRIVGEKVETGLRLQLVEFGKFTLHAFLIAFSSFFDGTVH